MTDDELASIAELLPKLLDRFWRLENLYLILNEKGILEPFRARPEQMEYRLGRHTRNFVPKARKLGMSTEVVIEFGDECVFTPNLKAGIIDLKEDDAYTKLEMFRLAWRSGPEFEWEDPRIRILWKAIHEAFPLIIDNAGKLGWGNGSIYTASTSYTGTTPQRLLWSEAGPMSAQRPQQARKIRRGSINSAPPGAVLTIETTMEGPRVGVAYEICELARAKQEKGTPLSVVDWKIHFFSWLGHPSYRLPGAKPVESETRVYFKDLAAEGVHATEEQQAWYEAKRAEQKGEMKQQYPSTLTEALSFEGDRPRFSRRALAWLELQLREAVITPRIGQLVQQRHERPTMVDTDEEESWFRMWIKPEEGYSYLLTADFCDAEYDDLKQDMDKHAVAVLRQATWVDRQGVRTLIPATVVAAIRTDDRAALDVLARRIALMTAFYGHCPAVVEINKHLGYIDQLRQAGVQEIWRRPQHVDDPGRGTGRTEYVPGWKTTPQSKPIIIEALDTALREHQLQLWCPRMVSELRYFQQNNQALDGQHDDWVMALAFGLYALGAAKRYTEVVPVVHDRTQLPPMPWGGGCAPGEQV